RPARRPGRAGGRRRARRRGNHPPPPLRRLLCDANVHRLVADGPSAILDYGRAVRTVTPAQWTALVLRDKHCTFQGCDAAADRCEAHHIKHWIDGGRSDLDNYRLRCWHHHHLAHQPGWHEKLLPDGTVETSSPKGRVFRSKPHGA
ncbi:MAG: HNH endonuclease signature motif containing protein, partial [Acidimicrobiales bacterium]